MPIQRWRLTYSRSADAPTLSQREQIAAWDDTLAAAGLRDPERTEQPKLSLAAPIPAGLTADRELADLFLSRRLTAADLRERLNGNLPVGHRLVDLHDVWLGEPALQGVVVAGDYLVRLESAPGAGRARPEALGDAIATFLAAMEIARPTTRPDRPSSGNLRQLVVAIRETGPDELWMRLRFDPTLGTGRPDEVVEVLGTLAGEAIVAVARHRERLWLRGEVITEPDPIV